jgi:hypothetical protein
MAEIKFTQLPAGAPITGPEIFAMVQSGVSVQTTANALSEFISDAGFNYGDGITFDDGTNTISADINTTNLQFTATQINTIQDIDVTANPTFNDMTLTGRLECFSGFQSYDEQILINSSQNVDTTIIGRTAIVDSVAAVVLTIPLNAGFNVNAQFDVIRADLGTVNITAAAGVTINGVNGATFPLPDQWDRAVFRELSENNWTAIEYSGAEGTLNLQDAYDNGDGTITLIAGKPFQLISTSAGFLMPSMTEAEFDAIALPDNGLISWANTSNRFRVNRGSTGTPNYADLAYFTDIPQDTTAFGEAFFQDNAIETVIVTPGVAVKVNSTYSSGDLLNFTQASGTLTYTGSETKEFDLCLSLTTTLNLNTANISVLIYVNGSPLAKSKQSTFTGSTTPFLQSGSVNALVELSTNDTVEVFVQNNTNTSNITVQDLNLNLSTVGGAIGNLADQVVVAWDGSMDPPLLLV